MQTCAVLGALVMLATLIGSFIPVLDFEKNVESPGICRVLFLVLLLGLIRGAF